MNADHDARLHELFTENHGLALAATVGVVLVMRLSEVPPTKLRRLRVHLKPVVTIPRTK